MPSSSTEQMMSRSDIVVDPISARITRNRPAIWAALPAAR
jgi:hypothetical protein